MTTRAQIFATSNPWWADPGAIDRDMELTRYRASSVKLDLPLPFDFEADAVYTLRGPRQVGKSTILKRAIAWLLTERRVPARSILYHDIEGDGIATVPKLRGTLDALLAQGRLHCPNDRLYLFVDELTGVRDWGTVVRTLFKDGKLANVTAVLTGSHALDIKRGADTAPGRRGEAAVGDVDWILMPFGFRDYARARVPDLVGRLPPVDPLHPQAAFGAAEAMLPDLPVIANLFEQYLLTGGFPHAVASHVEAGSVGNGVYRLYRDAVLGQMRRAGYESSQIHELITWAARNRLGQEFSWHAASGEMSIGTKDTVRKYISDAEQLFLWHIMSRSQSATTLRVALKSPKKLYPADPFTWHMMSNLVAGETDEWGASLRRVGDPTIRGGLVESVVGDHYIRGFAPLAMYHRTDGGYEEIDLLVERGRAQGRIEIKYRERVRKYDENAMARYGGGIVATPDDLAWDGERKVARIPVCLMLAGYADRITLYPSRG